MTTSSNPGLLDTNVLVYAHYQQSPHHAACRALLTRAQSPSASLCIAPQNLIEFYAVVTNPRRVNPAKSPADALAALAAILALPGMILLTVPADIVQRWTHLVGQYPVVGRKVFDVQLIGTMMGNGISTIYTLNVNDFQGFAGIHVLTP